MTQVRIAADRGFLCANPAQAIKASLLADQLEALIDQHDFAQVIEALATVASAKADHVREAWQSELLGEAYDKLTGRLVTLELQIREGRL